MDRMDVGAEGEIVLNAEMLEYLGIQPGEQVALFKMPGGVVRIRKAAPMQEQPVPRRVVTTPRRSA